MTRRQTTTDYRQLLSLAENPPGTKIVKRKKETEKWNAKYGRPFGTTGFGVLQLVGAWSFLPVPPGRRWQFGYLPVHGIQQTVVSVTFTYGNGSFARKETKTKSEMFE